MVPLISTPSIETEEADRLARELSRLTGESITRAITLAIRERLDRLRHEQEGEDDYLARVQAFVRNNAPLFDRRPISSIEWNDAVGDTSEYTGLA